MNSLSASFGPAIAVPQPSLTWFESRQRRSANPPALRHDPIETLRQAGQAISIRRDESLFCEGDPAQAMFIVLSGTVRLSKMLPDGRRQIIGFPEAGDLIGLAIDDDYLYSAEGVTQVRLRRIARARLDALMESHPELRTRLFSVAAQELAAAQRQILLLGRKTARERLCSFLMERKRAAAGRIELPMSRTDIADYLGLTIETVSRTLSQLRAEGLIRMPTLHSLELADAGRVCDLAEAA